MFIWLCPCIPVCSQCRSLMWGFRSVTVEEIELQEIEIERKHLEDATRLADAHAERQRVRQPLDGSAARAPALTNWCRISLCWRSTRESGWKGSGRRMRQLPMHASCSGWITTGSAWYVHTCCRSRDKAEDSRMRRGAARVNSSR